MRKLLYLSTLGLILFLHSSCSKDGRDGTYVNFTVMNKSGFPQEGKSVYVFKESSDVTLNKKPSDALRIKFTDAQGKVQFNLQDPDLFEIDESAVFSFKIMEISGLAYAVIGSFEQEIQPGDIVNETITVP